MNDRSEGRATNDWIRGEMGRIAESMGLDQLPMRDPGFDFYRMAVTIMRQTTGLGGQDLHDAAHEVLQRLFFNDRTGLPGVIFNFPSFWDKNHSAKFDVYFMYAMKQKSINYARNVARQKKNRALSIVPGKSDDNYGGVSEEELGEIQSPEDEVERREEEEKRNLVFGEIPQMLSSQRHGEKLLEIWEMMKKGYKLWEMVEELNAKGVTSPSGKEWGTGSVHKVRNTILELVKRFSEGRGINWKSVLSSRSSSRIIFGK